MRTFVLTLVLVVSATTALMAAPIVERVYSNYDSGNDGWIPTPKVGTGGVEYGAASSLNYSKTAPASWRNCPYGHDEGLGGHDVDPSTVGVQGYLMVKDAWTRSGPAGVVAPSPYSTTLTDWAADPLTESLSISFDGLELDTTDGGFDWYENNGVPTKSGFFGTVIIEGTGGKAQRDLEPFYAVRGSSTIGNDWTRYSVDLIGSGGLDTRSWTGDLAGELGDVTRIQVLLESRASLYDPFDPTVKLWETTGFDNFMIARQSGQPEVPELPAVALAALGLAPLAAFGLRRRTR